MIRYKHKLRHFVLGSVSIMILLAGLLMLSGSRPTSASAVNCQAFPAIPVSLTDLGIPTYHVWGELCATQQELHQPDGTATVQLLLPGLTYGHVYWDFPAVASAPNSTFYSYARNEAASGYPTFVLDRIGIGYSDHPPSVLIDTNTNATVAHRVVQGLRDGSITGIHFGKIIEMGHSFGSIVAMVEAATYQDVDGLILTGALHHLNPAFTSVTATAFYPAGQDPRFANQPWASDPGYSTTRPPTNGDIELGYRAQLFYNTAIADPNVIATDEQTKETITTEELDSMTAALPSVGLLLKVPVLLIYGTKDFLACDSSFDCSNNAVVQQEETPFYSSQTCLQFTSVAQSGHDVSLHPNNNVQVNAAQVWSDQFIGRTTNSQPPGCPHAE